jgi:F0F1-type ATP synthase delta subunit
MGVIAKRYAEALVKIAVENNSLDQYEQELELMKRLLPQKR